MPSVIVAEFENDKGESYKVTKDGERYDVWLGDVIVQPNHTADGVVSYLSLQLHNLYYLRQKSCTSP